MLPLLTTIKTCVEISCTFISTSSLHGYTVHILFFASRTYGITVLSQGCNGLTLEQFHINPFIIILVNLFSNLLQQ